MVISQYDVLLIDLDPTVGHEIKKARPCAVISPAEMNNNLATLIIAPMTTQSRPYPSRVPVTFANKHGWIVLDQIRTIDRKRVVKYLGRIAPNTVQALKKVLQEMLVD